MAWRILWGLFMLVVVVGTGALGWHRLDQARVERISTKVREWDFTYETWEPPVKSSLKTRCSGGNLRYIVVLRRTDDKVFEHWPNVTDLTLYFRDADGFTLAKAPVTTEQWFSLPDKTGFKGEGSIYLDCRDYLTLASLTFRWKEAPNAQTR